MTSKANSSVVKIAGLAVALLAASPLLGSPLAAQDIDGVIATVARRWFLTQADARCHLLDPATATALKGGYVQARNEAIRHGRDMAVLGPYLDAARAAADRSDCNSPQLNAEIASARASFSTYAAMPRLELPGSRSAWHADRTTGDANAWRLVQYGSGSDIAAAMGLFGTLSDNRLVVMAQFKDGAQPYAARLLVRDPDVAPVGIISASMTEYSSVAPPGFTSATLAFPARAITGATVALRPSVQTNGLGFSLSGQYVGEHQGPQAATRFDFSTRAYPAIARLDPREDMVVEFDFDDGPKYLRFEVGDFITGLSYVELPSPYGGKLAG